MIPGVAQYETTKYDERYVKPAKHGSSNKAQKFTYVDELQFVGKQKPGIYDLVKLVSFSNVIIFLGHPQEKNHTMENQGRN